MKPLGLVHLIRAANGIEPFRRFVEAYREYPGGVEHELVLLFKGFSRKEDTAEYEALLPEIRYQTYHVTDEGYDITAYFAVVDQFADTYRYFCFVNSHSTPLDAQWLRKLYDAVVLPGVDAAGATGSWNSNHTNAVAWFRSIVPAAFNLAKRKFFRAGNAGRPPAASANDSDIAPKMVARFFRHIRSNTRNLLLYPAFPNFHLRTNAFIVAGRTMQSIECPSIKAKSDAYRFESGRQGFTMQLLRNNRSVVVVGRDGKCYEKEAWDASHTFWSDQQQNLLVADNQTADYALGADVRRTYLSSLAWGKDLSSDHLD